MIVSNDSQVLNVTSIDETENGKIENNSNTCYRFDWKLKIPMNYEITDVKRIEELKKKRYEATKIVFSSYVRSQLAVIL